MGAVDPGSLVSGLVAVAELVAKLVQQAEYAPGAVERALLYIDAVHKAIVALGQEREQILAAVEACKIRNAESVWSVRDRLDRYLHNNTLRDPLDAAIERLQESAIAIRQLAERPGTPWGKRARQEGALEFAYQLDKLARHVSTLDSNFYPTGSGVGVQTLYPIFNKLTELRDAHESMHLSDSAAVAFRNELEALVKAARDDPTHAEWRKSTKGVSRWSEGLLRRFGDRPRRDPQA